MAIRAIIIALLCFVGCTAGSSQVSGPSDISNLPELDTVEDVIKWSNDNLYYKNVDKWDRAPTVYSVIDDGYGDCKMLAGVVSVLLDSVGQPNKFIVIKKKYWHMFNAYQNNGKYYVIENARLLDREFVNHDDIKKHFGVTRFEKVFTNYNDFRKWFNWYIYPKN